VKAKITSQIGNGTGGQIFFKIESDKPVKKSEAIESQCELGYNHVGYGFYCFDCKEVSDKLFVATWHCYASCD